MAGSVPSKAVREASPPDSSGLLAFFGVPGLEKASPHRCLHLYSHGILMSVSGFWTQISPFHKNNSQIGSKPNLMAPSLVDHLHRPYFQIRSPSQVLRDRTSTAPFREMLFDPFISQR